MKKKQIKQKVDEVIAKTVEEFGKKLGDLLIQIVTDKISVAEKLIWLEEDMLEEISRRNISGMQSSELLSLIDKTENLVHRSLEYLREMKGELQGAVSDIVEKEKLGALSVLSPQERERIRHKIMEEIKEVKKGKEDDKEGEVKEPDGTLNN